MLNNLKARRDELLGKKQDGFTIVEVMIVLAIAGLIILIVFLAVPALQRNSRNTQRVNDISAIGGAINNYVTSHNGIVPKDQTTLNTAIEGAKLGYYSPNTSGTGGVTNISWSSTPPASGSGGTTSANMEAVSISSGKKCNTEGTALDTSATASPRVIVAQYYIETGGTSPQLQCREF